jgi:glutamate racemase
MINEQAIGVFDSGAGGLGVLSAISQLLPHEHLIYVADTLNAPYGLKTDDFIECRVHEITRFLLKQPVKLIVLACNTATATAVESL